MDMAMERELGDFRPEDFWCFHDPSSHWKSVAFRWRDETEKKSWSCGWAAGSGRISTEGKNSKNPKRGN